MVEYVHVDGEDKGDVKLFALSTCQWCKQERMFLEENEIKYDYIYADLTQGDERKEVLDELKKFNEELSFPTLIINGKTVIKGFEEEDIKKELGI